MYADDSTLKSSGLSVEDAQASLQETLNSASVWFKNNKLAVNAAKSNVMLIGKKHKITDKIISVTLNNTMLMSMLSHFKANTSK